MTVVKARDRLQPALLDRLRDDEVDVRTEAVERQVLSRAQLRQAVLRDLAWLFNATAASDDCEGSPFAAGTVLFYGLPAWAGKTASSLDIGTMEQAIRNAISNYEPRLLPGTLRVEASVSDEQLDWHNQLHFRISAQLWAQPLPLELLLQTDIDLETGRVHVRDLAG